MKKQIAINNGIKDIYEQVSKINLNSVTNELKSHDFGILSSSEISCIQSISENSQVNVTSLSESLSMTTSAISKITKKLENKNLIRRYNNPKNNKEVYFALTESGNDIYIFHEKMSNKFFERDKFVYEQFSDTELDTIINFMTAYNKHLNSISEKEEI